MGLSTLEKGLDILALFDGDHREMSVREIAARMNLLESTLYRYVATLKSRGLLEETGKQGHYQLGLTILAWYQSLRRRFNIIDLALPIMHALVETIGETVLLATVHGQRGICLERVESSHVLRVAYERGRTLYLHAGATGKVLLAFLSEGKREAIIREVGLPKLTDNTITDPDELRVSLTKIREDGFAVTDGEQLGGGIRAITAPVFDHTGRIAACISVEGPISRLEGRLTENAIEKTVAAAKRITQILEDVSY